MLLPTRRKGEEESKFVSRCISELSKKGEGKNSAQRVAICKSRASISLTDEELETIGVLAKEVLKKKGETTKDSKLKKKPKDY